MAADDIENDMFTKEFLRPLLNTSSAALGKAIPNWVGNAIGERDAERYVEPTFQYTGQATTSEAITDQMRFVTQDSIVSGVPNWALIGGAILIVAIVR